MAEVTPDDTVRALFASYERDGLDAALEQLDDDVVLLLGPDEGRILRGTGELRAMVAELRREGVDLTARRDGLDESQQHWVFHVVGGRLRRLSTYATRDEALSSLTALEAIAPMPGFDVAEEAPAPGKRTVRPAGELDIATAPHLERALLHGRRAGETVILDLGGLTFIDSTGLRVIVRGAEAARREGWTLTIRPGPPPVQRIFDLAGIADALPFEAP
jgi:anti-anti-sigma factor